MQEIIDGDLGLYVFRADGNHDFGNRYLYKKYTNQGLEISILLFRNSLIKFLSECDQMVSGLNSKQYCIKNLETLVEDYNTQCVKQVEPTDRTSESNSVAQEKSTGDLMSDLKELNALINDIIRKLENNEPIPGYLKEALESYLSKDPNQMIRELMEKLEE